MSKTYRLDKISDLLSIPLDKLDQCMEELKLGIETAHFVGGTGASPDWFDGFVWRDDGKNSTDVTFDDGTTLVVEMTEDGR